MLHRGELERVLTIHRLDDGAEHHAFATEPGAQVEGTDRVVVGPGRGLNGPSVREEGHRDELTVHQQGFAEELSHVRASDGDRVRTDVRVATVAVDIDQLYGRLPDQALHDGAR